MFSLVVVSAVDMVLLSELRSNKFG